jgi:hypothetical protein
MAGQSRTVGASSFARSAYQLLHRLRAVKNAGGSVGDDVEPAPSVGNDRVTFVVHGRVELKMGAHEHLFAAGRIGAQKRNDKGPSRAYNHAVRGDGVLQIAGGKMVLIAARAHDAQAGLADGDRLNRRALARRGHQMQFGACGSSGGLNLCKRGGCGARYRREEPCNEKTIHHSSILENRGKRKSFGAACIPPARLRLFAMTCPLLSNRRQAYRGRIWRRRRNLSLPRSRYQALAERLKP